MLEGSGPENGTEKFIRERNERVEDIEDLMRFGATYHEIMERGAYKSVDSLRRALKRSGREDLWDRLKTIGGIQVGKNRYTN